MGHQHQTPRPPKCALVQSTNTIRWMRCGEATTERRKHRNETEWEIECEEQAHTELWFTPIPATIADALANNRGLLERLKQGMYAPDNKGKEQYQVIFNGLFATTREQIAALEVFARVDWE
jgi:hypothetical protein